jgi:hypothetical protein
MADHATEKEKEKEKEKAKRTPKAATVMAIRRALHAAVREEGSQATPVCLLPNGMTRGEFALKCLHDARTNRSHNVPRLGSKTKAKTKSKAATVGIKRGATFRIVADRDGALSCARRQIQLQPQKWDACVTVFVSDADEHDKPKG